jgi:hypothetical protein
MSPNLLVTRSGVVVNLEVFNVCKSQYVAFACNSKDVIKDVGLIRKFDVAYALKIVHISHSVNEAKTKKSTLLLLLNN